MFEAVSLLVAEHAELEGRMADPSVHSDPSLARRIGQRYAELSAVLRTHAEWVALGDDLQAARELAGEDESFAEEATELSRRLGTAEERLRQQLVPRDPSDGKDVLLEVKSGRVGRSLRSSPATCCECTPATPSDVAGRRRCSTRRSRTSAATSR